MPIISLPPTPAARRALLDWCARHSVGPKQLAAALRCDYQHAWTILRADYPITLPMLGRLLIHYGVNGPAPAIAAALKLELDRLHAEAQKAAE